MNYETYLLKTDVWGTAGPCSLDSLVTDTTFVLTIQMMGAVVDFAQSGDSAVTMTSQKIAASDSVICVSSSLLAILTQKSETQ